MKKKQNKSIWGKNASYSASYAGKHAYAWVFTLRGFNGINYQIKKQEGV